MTEPRGVLVLAVSSDPLPNDQPGDGLTRIYSPASIAANLAPASVYNRRTR